MNPLQKLKAELKAMAIEIKTKRQAFKDKHRAVSAYDLANPGWRVWRSSMYEARYRLLYGEPWAPTRLSTEYRYKSVAYALLRGRKYEDVERTVRPGNEIDMARVDLIVKEVESEFEALRVHAS